MFKAIANWFKGLFGKAEQQVAKDSQIVDQWNEWNRVVASTPAAKVEEVKQQEAPVVLKETVKPAEAKKSTSRKSTSKPAGKTTKTSTKTSKAPAQKAAPKSKTTKTTK